MGNNLLPVYGGNGHGKGQHRREAYLTVVWVLLTNDDAKRSELIVFLRKQRKYTLTDKGEATWLLGIALSRDRVSRTITLSQKLYVQNILARFAPYLDRSNARNFDVPVMSDLSSFNASQCPAEGSEEYERMLPLHHVYMQMIGALIWLSSCTHCSFP